MPEQDMMIYPLHRIMAIVDTDEEVRAAVDALEAAGFSHEELVVLTGAEGAERIDAHGGQHGLFGRIVRAIEFMTMDAIGDAERYQEAAEQGRYVVTVHAPDEEPRARAHAILKEHGAHFVNYYGKLASEELEP